MKRTLENAAKRLSGIALAFLLLAGAAAMASEAGDLPALSAPEGLGWGRDYSLTLARYNREHHTEAEYVDFPGMMYWSLGETTQYVYAISLYRQEEEEPVLVESIPSWTVSKTSAYGCCFRFLLHDPEDRTTWKDGDYYFTVKALGDGVRYSDSEEIISPVWHYALPVRGTAASDSGTAVSSSGTVVSSSGTAVSSSGTAVSSSGTVVSSSGTAVSSSGTAVSSSGTIISDSSKKNIKRLTALECPYWDGNSSVSVQALDPENTAGFQVQWFYQAKLEHERTNYTLASELELRTVGSVLTFASSGVTVQLTEKMLAENGAGWYSFRVRALSRNIASIASSPWSSMSRQRYFSAGNTSLTSIAASVRSDSLAEDKQRAIRMVREIGFQTLKQAMAADQDNTGAVERLRHLEEVTGNQAAISVSAGMSEIFSEENISIVGAGLNVDLGERVTLEIAEPQEGQTAPGVYENAVKFSMRLADAEGREITGTDGDLPVPMKITLPVPEGVNPDYFVILHYRHTDSGDDNDGEDDNEDGAEEYEEITNPYLYQAGGRWYASFLIGNFSDFAIAERAETAEARRTAEGVEIECAFRESENRTLCCAVYGQAGQMLGAAFFQTGTRRVLIPCGSAEAVSVKVFTLDAQAPAAAARVLPLPASE